MTSAAESASRVPATRLHAVDAVRVIAILGVVILHAKPFASSHYAGTVWASFGEIITQGARFAVPYFFAASGYFLGKKPYAGSGLVPISPYAKRIATLYVIWCLIYALLPPNGFLHAIDGDLRPFYWHAANQWASLVQTPWLFLLKGTRVHLWFLPALFIAVLFFSACSRFLGIRACLLVTGVLYAIGLLAVAYSNVLPGISINPVLAHAFLYAPLYVALGAWLASRPPPGLVVALLCVAGGFALQVFEAWLLANAAETRLFSNFDFYLGTVPLGVGALALALSRPQLGRFTLAPMGNLVLGVYLIHLLVKDVLLVFDRHFGGPAWEVAFPLLILATSLALVRSLSQTRFRTLLQ